MDWVFNYTPAGSHNDHLGAVRLTEVRHAATNFRAIAYQCRLEEDFDGAPDAYGRDNDHPVDPALNPDTWMQQGVNGRDRLCNATRPHQECDAGRHNFAYVGLFAATQDFARAHGFSIDKRPFLEARQRMGWVKHGKDSAWELIPLGPHEPGFFPAIQAFEDLSPGHFVSTTSALANPHLDEWVQRRYVDASTIPYAAYAGWWARKNVQLGDFGLAIARDTGTSSGFVFGDTGSGNVGEVSNKLLSTLTSAGGTNENLFTFIVFPGSGGGVAGKFTQDAVIQTQVRQRIQLLNQIDGSDEFVEFLAFDTNKPRLEAWRAGARQNDAAEIAGGGRYDTMMMALMAKGFGG